MVKSYFVKMRRSFKKVTGYRERPNAGRLAMRKIRQLKRNIEKKYVVENAGSLTVENGLIWHKYCLGPMLQQGDASTMRHGVKVTVKSLALRYSLNAAAAMPLGGLVRVCLVWDKRPQGVNPDGDDVFNSDTIYAGMNIVGMNRGRFIMIFDKIYEFQANEVRHMDSFYCKGNFQTEYNTGNAGTLADIDKGCFFLFAAGASNAQDVTINYGFRIRFTDD